jgi:hypothetical protein
MEEEFFNIKKSHIYADKPIYGDPRKILFYIIVETFNNKRYVITPNGKKEIINEGIIPNFSDHIEVNDEDAQIFVEQLWNLGIRPHAARGTQGQLQAIENHLNDMRKIAFSGLGLENKI